MNEDMKHADCWPLDFMEDIKPPKERNKVMNKFKSAQEWTVEKTKVFELLGEATMGWKPIPTGVFDSTRVAEIGEEIWSIFDTALSSLREERDKLSEWQRDVQEREGACCPEDRSFDEVIASLREELKQIREYVGGTGLAEIEGSTLGMVVSISDYAMEQSKHVCFVAHFPPSDEAESRLGIKEPRADHVNAVLQKALNHLRRYVEAIDAIYSHNEAARVAVVSHFGTYHPREALDMLGDLATPLSVVSQFEN